MKIKPAGGMVALEFLDGEEDADEKRIRGGATNDADESALLVAMVEGVGPDVKRLKAGDTVLVRPWARGGARFENVVFADQWSVVAVVTGG